MKITLLILHFIIIIYIINYRLPIIIFQKNQQFTIFN